MTPTQLRAAADTFEALRDVLDVRRELKNGKTTHLSVEAYEDQGGGGGVGHASTMVPLHLASTVLDAVETVLHDEATKLGVKLPKPRKRP